MRLGGAAQRYGSAATARRARRILHYLLFLANRRRFERQSRCPTGVGARPSEGIAESYYAFLCRHKNGGDAGTALEHRAPFQPDDDDGSSDKQDVVPGLGVGPNGVIHLEVEQGGE